MPTRYYQNSDCEPIGELSLSRYEGEVWEHGLQNDWEIQAGTTDLYWNMTNLNIGERYKLSFYAYVDDQIYYPHSSGDIWYADSENASWHFDFDIGSDTCNVYGYADLRVWWDGGFRTINSVHFRPDEPCVPPYDVLFEDPSSSSGWTDATSASIPQGSTEILFDLSDFGYGEYEVDYYWSGDHQAVIDGMDNIFTVNETLDGFYWTINPDDDDREQTFTQRPRQDSQQYIGHGSYH